MGNNQHTFDRSSYFSPSVNNMFMTSWKWIKPLQRGTAANLEEVVRDCTIQDAKICHLTGHRVVRSMCDHTWWSAPWICLRDDSRTSHCCSNEACQTRAHGADLSCEGPRIHSGRVLLLECAHRWKNKLLTSTSRMPCSVSSFSHSVMLWMLWACWRMSWVLTAVLSGQVFVISESSPVPTKQMGHSHLEVVPWIRAIVHLCQISLWWYEIAKSAYCSL